MTDEPRTELQDSLHRTVEGQAAIGRILAKRACPAAAVAGDGTLYRCQSHAGGKHHFAFHWPACPAPWCRLPEGHAEGLHDIPAGMVTLCDRPAAGDDPADEMIRDRGGNAWHVAVAFYRQITQVPRG